MAAPRCRHSGALTLSVPVPVPTQTWSAPLVAITWSCQKPFTRVRYFCVTLSTVGDAFVVGEEVPPEHAHSATPMIDTITGNDFSFGTFLVLRFRPPRVPPAPLRRICAASNLLRRTRAGAPPGSTVAPRRSR